MDLSTPRASRNLFGARGHLPWYLRSGMRGVRTVSRLAKYALNPYVPTTALALGLAAGSKRKSPKSPGKHDKVTFANASGTGQAFKVQGKRKRTRKVKTSIKKRVKQLEKKVRENYAKHVFKFDYAYRVGSLTNTAGYGSLHWINGADFNTTIDEVPYVDPTLPSTEKQFNMSVVSQPQKVKFSWTGKAVFRNNYLYPCDITIYLLAPKQDTNNSPGDDVQNGLTQLANAGITTWAAYNLYPTDSKRFVQGWKIIKMQKLRLQTGDEMTFHHSENFTYDPKDYANIGTTYQRKYSRVLFTRCSGVVAHESATPANVGTAPTELDVMATRKFVMHRPCEAPFETLQQVRSGTVIDLTTPIVGAASAEVENTL